MNNKERLAMLSIFISIFGFSLFNVINPLEQRVGKPSLVVTSEYLTTVPTVQEEESSDLNLETDRDHSKFDASQSRMVNMLSSVLGMSTSDVRESLDGGVKPSEMLADSGVLLSDLAEDYNFELVGSRGLVKFREA